MELSVLSKAWGTAVVVVNSVGQGRVPYLPLDQLCEKRDRRVRWMVRYAAETVPYYRDLFRELGIDPSEIRTADDLDRLPLLDKASVRANPERFVSTSRWGRTAVPHLTSGTTGQPLTVFHDRNSLLADTGVIRRHAAVVQAVLGRRSAIRGLSVGYAGGAYEARQAFLQQASFRLRRRQAVWLPMSAPLDDVIAALNHHRPDVLACLGSYADALFRNVAALDRQVYVPPVIVYGGDSITDSGRELIQHQFGAVLLSNYECVEVHKIGFTCEHATGFHLHMDLTHVRIVNEQGRRLPPGQKGEVVVSNLVNRGSVLLNYRLGDVAALTEEPCPCGRTMPLLTELEGRVEDIIYLPNGDFVHPRLVWKALKHRQGLLRYQLVQRDPEAFELRLSTVDEASFEGIAAAAIAELRPLLGESAVISPVRCQSLGSTGGRKFRPVVALAAGAPGAREVRQQCGEEVACR